MSPIKNIFPLLLLLLPAVAMAGVSPWVPFNMHDGIITIDVEIDGQPARAMLVTTTNYGVIDEEFLAGHPRPIGKPAEESRSDGFVTQGALNDVPVRLFGSQMNLDNVTTGSLGPADLLLGLGFFQCCIIQIDYPGQRMRLIDRDSLDLKKAANVTFRQDLNTRMPLVQVTLDGGTETWLTLNTGASSGGLLIDRDLAEKRGWLEKYPLVESQSQSLTGKPVTFESFQMAALQFGPVELSNVKVSVVKDANGKPKDPDRTSRGFLGYDVLKHFIVTIDYLGERMHIALPPEA